MSQELLIEGGCHCRAVRYALHWPVSEGSETSPVIPARRCGCSYCTRIDGVWTSHPRARLVVRHDSNDELIKYRFATGTADFLVCSRCGITALVTCDMDEQRYAVVNVNTFDAHEGRFTLELSDSNFDGEVVGDRLKRRKARWIGTVEWEQR